MIWPKKLESGDTIALVAPSFGCTIEPYLTRLDVAIKQWKKKGFQVQEGKNIRLEEGVAASASPKQRAEEFMDAFASDASLVLSVGGGELMAEILPELDFQAIARGEPKWFMGFSDNTNLTFVLTTHCDLVTIYGPCAPHFFQKKWRLCEADAYDMLLGKRHFEGYPKYSISGRNANPLISYWCTQKKVITPYGYEKPFRGVMMGGCLDVLAVLVGTPFDRVKEFQKKHPEGIIWYLEACDLTPLGLRRAYLQLREAGWFDNAVGFVLGRMKSAQEELMGASRFNAAIDLLGPLGKPILMDCDLGHISPSMPILNGATATVGLKDGNLVIDYEE